MSNPLLDFSALPAFDRISPSDVAPALDVLLADANQALETVTAADFAARWSDIAAVLDVSTEKLGRAWGVVSHLSSVADLSNALRQPLWKRFTCFNCSSWTWPCRRGRPW